MCSPSELGDQIAHLAAKVASLCDDIEWVGEDYAEQQNTDRKISPDTFVEVFRSISMAKSYLTELEELVVTAMHLGEVSETEA